MIDLHTEVGGPFTNVKFLVNFISSAKPGHQGERNGNPGRAEQLPGVANLLRKKAGPCRHYP
jgi:hypothetical protein